MSRVPGGPWPFRSRCLVSIRPWEAAERAGYGEKGRGPTVSSGPLRVSTRLPTPSPGSAKYPLRSVPPALQTLLLAALTGLAVFATARLPGAPRDALVIGHACIAGAAVLGGLVALVRHLRATGGGMVPTLALWAFVGALCGPAASALHFPEPIGFWERQRRAVVGALAEAGDKEDPARWFARLEGTVGYDWGGLVGAASVGALLLVFGGLAVVGAARLGQGGRRLHGYALAGMAGWAAATGVAIPLVDREAIIAQATLHSVSGLGVVVLLLLHAMPTWSRAGRVLWFARSGTAGLFLLVASALWWSLYATLHHHALHADRKAEVFSLVATPQGPQGRHAAHADPRPRVRDMLDSSASCGGEGCHDAIVADWAGSPHRYAASNTFYRAAVGELLRERPAEDALFCASCHDPARAAAGTAGHDYGDPSFGDSGGVGCAACHGISHVFGAPPSNGAFAMAVDLRAPAADPLARLATRLDPRRHRERFLTRGVALDASPCRSCHRLELGPDFGPSQSFVLQHQDTADGLLADAGANCVSCHLPTDRTGLYRHRMAGIAADLRAYVDPASDADRAAVLGHERAAADLTGARPWAPFGEEGPRPSFGTLEGAFRGAAPTAIHLRVEDLAVQGAEVSVQFVTVNGTVGHALPSGPFDLQRMWLEVLAVDAHGLVLAHEGDPAADPDGDRALFRLGARELRSDGSPLPRHRLWELDRVEGKRQIGPGPVRDRWTFMPPPGTRGPIRLRARWLFRRVHGEFERWARSEVGTPGAVTLLDLASVEHVVPWPPAP